MTKPKTTYQVSVAQQEYALPNGKVMLLGAVDTVTPTSTLVEMDGDKVLVDCGVRPGDTLDFRALEARALVLTHGHFDHAGGLPELLAAGRIGTLYATAPTLEIVKIMLKDSIRHKGGGAADYLRFKETFKRVARRVAYGESFSPVPGNNMTVSLHKAGHLFGSCSVEVCSADSRIVISGDLGCPRSPIIGDYNTEWRREQPVDLVLLESTCGERNAAVSLSSVERQLESIIERALSLNGHLLVPSFAIGRTQVLLYLLNNLVASGRIDPLPVAVDTPGGLQVMDTHTRLKRLYDRDTVDRIDRGDEPINFDSLYGVRRKRDLKRLDQLTDPALIIAGAGIHSMGRLGKLMVELLQRSETQVLFVGQQTPGTPLAVLQQSGTAQETTEQGALTDLLVAPHGAFEPRASFHTLDGISIHADQSGLMAWLDSIPDVRHVGLYHGTENAQRACLAYMSGEKTG